jgi:hypothetical protein
MKNITWNNANGQEIKITVKLVSNMINFDVSVAGNDIGHIIGGLKPVTGHATIVASLGKLGLNADRAEQVKQAITEVEATREAAGRSARELEMDEFDRKGYDLTRKMSVQA